MDDVAAALRLGIALTALATAAGALLATWWLWPGIAAALDAQVAQWGRG